MAAWQCQGQVIRHVLDTSCTLSEQSSPAPALHLAVICCFCIGRKFYITCSNLQRAFPTGAASRCFTVLPWCLHESACVRMRSIAALSSSCCCAHGSRCRRCCSCRICCLAMPHVVCVLIVCNQLVGCHQSSYCAGFVRVCDMMCLSHQIASMIHHVVHNVEHHAFYMVMFEIH